MADLKDSFIAELKECKVPDQPAIDEIVRVHNRMIDQNKRENGASMKMQICALGNWIMAKKFYEFIIKHQKQYIYSLYALKHEQIGDEDRGLIDDVAKQIIDLIDTIYKANMRSDEDPRAIFNSIVEDSLRDMHSIYLKVSMVDFEEIYILYLVQISYIFTEK